MDMLLETKKVTKIFGGLHANSDIDFSIDEGEIVASSDQMVQARLHFIMYLQEFPLQPEARSFSRAKA